jgi:predicted transcriptional regulator
MSNPKTQDKVRESEVEEALVSNLENIKTLLKLSYQPKLIARQLHLDLESRIDLLLMCGKDLVLIELKITPYYDEHLKQILRYRDLIKMLQAQNELPLGDIECYLLVTEYALAQHTSCKVQNVELVKYAPASVMNAHYQSLVRSTYFLRVKPNDYGVFSLGLINRTLLQLEDGEVAEKSIAEKISLSINSVRNHLKTAIEFGLVRRKGYKYFLTDLGDTYVRYCNSGVLREQMSETQAELLRQYVAKAPFSSGMVFGVYAIVESVFLLSRSSYPVEFKTLSEHFTVISGKVTEWKREKSRATATYTFLNFAIDLGLLGKMGSQVVITPSGFRFNLMLQLHKSIEMIDSLQS